MHWVSVFIITYMYSSIETLASIELAFGVDRMKSRSNWLDTLQRWRPARDLKHLLSCGRKGKLLHQRGGARHSRMIYFTATLSFFDDFFIFSDLISPKESRSFYCSRSNIHSGQTWGACAISAKIVAAFCRWEAKNKKCGNPSYWPRDKTPPTRHKTPCNILRSFM